MKKTTVLDFRFNQSRKNNEVEMSGVTVALVPFDTTSSREEKDYQRLVKEKLKAAADWDVRDAMHFKIK